MSYGKRYNIVAIAALVSLIVVYILRDNLKGGRLRVLPYSKANHSENVAVIIEDRPLANISPLLLHFSSVLGPSWPIIFYTSDSRHPNSTAFQRAVKEGRISIRSLPQDTEFTQHSSVSAFLTKPWFWEQLAPASHVLMFQADSIICANSDIQIEDFLEYDFVGAPIDVPADFNAGHGEGYNGGFSLRNRAVILDIVNKYSWQVEKDLGEISQEGCVTTKPCLKFEDQWFYHKMTTMPEVKLPTKEIASKFAVETVWSDRPLGYHQVGRWNKDKMNKVASWCPEYAMATNDLLVEH